MARTEAPHFGDGGFQIEAQPGQVDAPAAVGEGFQPALRPAIHLHGTAVILPLDVQVSHADLQDAAVKIPDRAGLFQPGLFEGLVGFPVQPGVEELQAADSHGVQVSRAFYG